MANATDIQKRREKLDKNRGITRFMALSDIDTEARTVAAAISSERPTREWFGTEVLSHAEGAIDLSRASEGLPLLFNHDPSQPIGIVRDLMIADGVLRGTLHFSRNSRAAEIWQDVADGFLKNMSVSGERLEWVETDTGIHTTKWAVLEASVVSVPADASVGIGRSFNPTNGATTMPTNETTGGGAPEDLNVTDFQRAREAAKKAGLEEGAKIERARQIGIREIFAPFTGADYDTLRDECLARGLTVDQSRAKLLELMGSGAQPLMADHPNTVEIATRSGYVPSGEAEIDKFQRGVTEALLYRTGNLKADYPEDKKLIQRARENEFNSMTMVEIAREYCRRGGIDVRGLSRDKIVGLAITRSVIGHSSSDFANILENIASKSLIGGYQEAPETWQQWCRVGSLMDFRSASRVALSSFGDLDLIKENGEYKFGTMSDSKESLQLATYGKMFNISRQALVNDDLQALSTIPRAMGRAAARKIGDIAYNILTSNPTLNQDSTALFHANHGNFVAGGSGAAPSVTTLNAAITAMATQTDLAGNTINIMPRYLIVPQALRATANVLMAAQYDPAGTVGTLTPNTVQGTMQVVSDARLDANDAAKWYVAADPNMADTVEVAFLDGNQTPYLEQKDGWNVDGVEFKARIDAVAAALDFRGLYHNDGN